MWGGRAQSREEQRIVDNWVPRANRQVRPHSPPDKHEYRARELREQFLTGTRRVRRLILTVSLLRKGDCGRGTSIFTANPSPTSQLLKAKNLRCSVLPVRSKGERPNSSDRTRSVAIISLRAASSTSAA